MEVKNLVNVVNAVIPLYFAILLGYLSVKPWNIFTQEQTKSLNTLNAVFVIPAFSFQFLAKTAIYDMNLIFVLADTVAKFGMLVGLGLWVQYLTAIPTVSGKWEWFVVSFMVASVANTLIIGIPLLHAMYGSDSATLLAQVVVVQLVLWFPVLQILSQLNTSIRSTEALKDLEDHSVAGSITSSGVADASVVGGTAPCHQDTAVQVQVEKGSNLRGDAVEQQQLRQKLAKENFKCIGGEGADPPNSFERVEERGGKVPKGETDGKRGPGVASITMQIASIRKKFGPWVNKLRSAALHHHFSGGKSTSKDSVSDYLKKKKTSSSSFITKQCKHTQPIQAVSPNGRPSPAAADTSARSPRADLRQMVMAPGACDTSGLAANSSGGLRGVGQGSTAFNPGLRESCHPLETPQHGELSPAVGESAVKLLNEESSTSDSGQGSPGMAAPAQLPAASVAGPLESQSRSESGLDCRFNACQLAQSVDTDTEAAGISDRAWCSAGATFDGCDPAATGPTLSRLGGEVPDCNLAGPPPSDSLDHQSSTDGTKCIQLDMSSTGVPTAHAGMHIITIKPPTGPLDSAPGASAPATTSLEGSMSREAKSRGQAKHARSCNGEEKPSNLPQLASRRKSEEKVEMAENGGGAAASAEDRGRLSATPGGAEGGKSDQHQQQITGQAGSRSAPLDFSSRLMPEFQTSSSGAGSGGGGGGGGGGGQVLTGDKEDKDFVTKSANYDNYPHSTYRQTLVPSLAISFMPARGDESGPVIEHPKSLWSQPGLATTVTPQQLHAKSQLIAEREERVNTVPVDAIVITSARPTAELLTPILSPTPTPIPVPVQVTGALRNMPIGERGRKKGRRPSVRMSRAEIKQAVKASANSFLHSQLVWASILGLTYSLIAGKLGFKMPTIIDKSLTLMANLCLGLSMFSLGLFMALQSKLIPIGAWTTTWTFSLRLFWGPLVVTIVTYLFGCRGLLLKVAFIQNALPQAVLTFVLANQFHLRADVLSTGVCFGTLVSLPLLIIYYVILEKIL
ncbi:hypothetical protein CBR_g41200 [Chara braunii]|uniref:Auxin efflux carrier component n=1 Tax=Chara braunii TaxID=69332 RepID=A0A388K2K4_CHABU|nr:hypothetical protein CBR_g41200 [Chara braunii]|eukprot:GBG64280.1 hypothetical protein CBR_g41200 [Chara braunii]